MADFSSAFSCISCSNERVVINETENQNAVLKVQFNNTKHDYLICIILKWRIFFVEKKFILSKHIVAQSRYLLILINHCKLLTMKTTGCNSSGSLISVRQNGRQWPPLIVFFLHPLENVFSFHGCFNPIDGTQTWLYHEVTLYNH